MPSRRLFLEAAAAAGTWLALGRPAGTAGASPAEHVRARVLGIAQDGGLPHLGCRRPCCVLARRDPGRSRKVAALGLSVSPSGSTFLVDATPDMPAQIDDLQEASGGTTRDRRPVDGILLTHAHIGHYTGLVHLGKEVMAAREVPVLATKRMCAFLRENRPWSLLVEAGHIVLDPFEPGERRELDRGLHVESIQVPHRDEASDTVGYLFRGPERSLLYVPDTDGWGRWSTPITSYVEKADVALLDGTFFDSGEVPWRDPADIPHPTIRSSLELLRPQSGRGRRILFTHLNHSNPALDEGSEAASELRRAGFAVAAEGMEFGL